MAAIRMIAGLGNPGREHERDRHNAGFHFALRLADTKGVALRPVARYRALVGRIEGDAENPWLILPQTYMNLSGQAVAAFARFHRIEPARILVAHDELDFPPGTVRLKLGGGVAGHNGLKDIAERLASRDFWRLRIGIGHPGDKNLVPDYVLSAPPAAERERIEAAIERCLEVADLLIAGEMQAAMNRLHARNAPEPR